MSKNYERLTLAIVIACAITVLIHFIVNGPRVRHTNEFIPGERFNSDE